MTFFILRDGRPLLGSSLAGGPKKAGPQGVLSSFGSERWPPCPSPCGRTCSSTRLSSLLRFLFSSVLISFQICLFVVCFWPWSPQNASLAAESGAPLWNNFCCRWFMRDHFQRPVHGVPKQNLTEALSFLRRSHCLGLTRKPELARGRPAPPMKEQRRSEEDARSGQPPLISTIPNKQGLFGSVAHGLYTALWFAPPFLQAVHLKN